MTSLRFGIVVKRDSKVANALAQELIVWAGLRKHKVSLVEGHGLINTEEIIEYSKADMVKNTDIIVVLGGDGTLIGTARFVKTNSPVFFGVNFGNLGFLTEFLPEQIFKVLDMYIQEKVSFEERPLLLAEVVRDNKTVFKEQAVNEALVQKATRDKLIELDLEINDFEVMRVRGDGIIISTPTGSTAYSLSAGGSIAYPSLEVLLLTPICAHSLTTRPLILPSDMNVKVKVVESSSEVFLSVDSQDSIALKKNDLVKITRSESRLKIAKSPFMSYFEVLRSKLHWGTNNINS